MTICLRHAGKSDTLKSLIRKEIESGIYQPMCRLPSTNELASKYSMSYVTVHKVLSELEAEGMIERKNGVGTFVARTEQTPTIGKVAVPLRLIKNPFFTAAYEEISRQANEIGVQVLFGAGDREDEFIDKLSDENCHAMLRFPGDTLKEYKLLERLKNNHIRTVILNDWWQEGQGEFPCIRSDEESGVLSLLDHLYEKGHSRIALYQEIYHESRMNLMKSFYQWHLRRGIMFSADQLIYSSDYEKSPEQLFEFIRNKHITAVISSYDFTAIQLMKNASECGLKIPNDLSICGFDNIPDASDSGLTTVKQDIPALVKEAFRVLLSASYEKCPVIKIPVSCIYRDSVLQV